jgi:hypothetical protein
MHKIRTAVNCLALLLLCPLAFSQALATDPFLTACGLQVGSSDPRRKTVDALIQASRPFVGYVPDATCEIYERVLFRARKIILTSFDLKDISPLAPLTQLEALDLTVNEITDLAPLAKMTRLRYLALADNAVTDITPLAGMVNLDDLSLEGNKIDSVKSLESLVNLRVLNLSFNRVVSIEAIGKLRKLEALQIQDNLVKTIDPASGLPLLRFLYAYQNRIVNLEGFAPGASMFRINLSGNAIPDDQILALGKRMGPETYVIFEKNFNYTNRPELLREQSASMEIK